MRSLDEAYAEFVRMAMGCYGISKAQFELACSRRDLEERLLQVFRDRKYSEEQIELVRTHGPQVLCVEVQETMALLDGTVEVMSSWLTAGLRRLQVLQNGGEN